MAKRKFVSVDFTEEPSTPIMAKTTNAVVTAVNAQQDYFWVGNKNYFELAQGVGAIGANTLLAANGLTPAANGWLLTLDNAATDSLEITNGIILGTALSFSPQNGAFFMRAGIIVPTVANVTHLVVGFRELGAYATASTAAEMKTAYDEKAVVGLIDNAGAIGTWTSKDGVDVGPTSFAASAAVAADLYLFEVNVSAAGAVTYRIGKATPSGATAAAVATARSSITLAADANAVAASFNATDVFVPTLVVGASGAGACDGRLVYWEAGYQDAT